MKFKNYNTNCGMLFLFETQNKDLVYATSDIATMYNDHFSKDSDSELFIGREFNFDSGNYKIKDICGYSSLQPGPDLEEYMSGKTYDYSYVLRLVVEPVK